jgi:hypothetical protein
VDSRDTKAARAIEAHDTKNRLAEGVLPTLREQFQGSELEFLQNSDKKRKLVHEHNINT